MAGREIKFRAWDVESNHMVSWVEIEGEWEDEGYITSVLAGDHYIPMQYTGLKDKNGVEAYHDDICKDSVGNVGVIQWNDRRARWELFISFGKIYELDWLWVKAETEIIGNRHQNPELLNAS